MPAIAQPHYELTQATLDNGLRVVVNRDPAVPVVGVNIWYDVGSRHEQPGKTGFAHLFEHLMFEGSENVKKGEHFSFINAAGGTLNATTWCDRTNYFETVPNHHLELVLWLEADRMGGLLDSLGQETLDNQRAVVKNERRQRVDNEPYGTWLEVLHEKAYPEGHPYHHSTIGSMADLDAASVDDARTFYLTHYAPNNAVLSVVGDVQPDEVLALTERYFGGLARREIPPPPPSELPPRIGTELREERVEDVPLPRMFAAYRCPPFGTADFDAAGVLIALLGNGRGSRLYRELVLRRGLAQGGDDEMMSSWGFVGGAALVVGDVLARDGVELAEVEGAYHEVVESVASGGVGDDELERAKAVVASGWLHQLSSVSGRADTFSQFATLLRDPELVNAQVQKWLSVDAARVQAVAAEVLRPDNRVVLSYLPLEAA